MLQASVDHYPDYSRATDSSIYPCTNNTSYDTTSRNTSSTNTTSRDTTNCHNCTTNTYPIYTCSTWYHSLNYYIGYTST